MIRNPYNTNLRYHHEDTYHGLPVQSMHGPLVAEYLARLHLTIHRALNEYPRVFAFRIDLRLPEYLDASPYLESNSLIESFIKSFRAKIDHNRAVAEKKHKRVHGTTVRYVWAREIGLCGRPHYHLVILLNNDAYCWLGDFKSDRENMFNRLQEAWASALRLSLNAVTGLVEVPRNPCYHLQRDDPQSVAALFYRASYLCKAATKFYGSGCHGFGSSRY